MVLKEFVCKKCSSIFIAGKGEYTSGSIRISDEKKKALYCRCPVCQKRTYMVLEEEEKGEQSNG